MTPEQIQLFVHGSEEYFFYGLQIGLAIVVSFYLILLYEGAECDNLFTKKGIDNLQYVG